jgi:hypothetical protein
MRSGFDRPRKTRAAGRGSRSGGNGFGRVRLATTLAHGAQSGIKTPQFLLRPNRNLGFSRATLRRYSCGRLGMKIVPLALLLLLHPVVAGAQTLVPPEVVRSENVRIDGDMKIRTVGNAQRHYTLFCNVKVAGCTTPERGKNYLLFDTSTRWKMPGAKDFITLAFVQDWTVKYNEGENIGLVPEEICLAHPGAVDYRPVGEDRVLFVTAARPVEKKHAKVTLLESCLF